MANEETTPLHIVELRSENVKRIRAVTVRPDGAVVLIGGRNAQGKTSLLDSIEMALGGGKTIPVEPVRRGARKARIVVDLGELVVERTFSAKGTELVVKGKDGMPKASPQKLLDTLCAKVAFDPLAFARMDPKDQDKLLKQLAGLDLSAIDAARAKVFEQRTEANRDVKRLEALFDAAPEHADAPKAPVDVAELSAELKAKNQELRDRAASVAAITNGKAELARLDAAIAKAKRELHEMETDRESTAAELLAAERDLPPEPDTASIEERLRTAEQTNSKVRANLERAKLGVQLETAQAAAQSFTETIASLDEERAEKLAAAKFPVDGLGFDETGPTFKGVPLAQASQAERLRVSVAIGAALNPRVKVMLVRDGSLLDEDSMRLLAELAEATGSQVWVERVGDRDASAIVIEDGSVLESSEGQYPHLSEALAGVPSRAI